MLCYYQPRSRASPSPTIPTPVLGSAPLVVSPPPPQEGTRADEWASAVESELYGESEIVGETTQDRIEDEEETSTKRWHEA
jgi:hypothetical protein